jgi:probable rRNA maturation factor
VQIEVSIQDSFLEEIDSAKSELISCFRQSMVEASWEEWFEQWARSLSSDLPQAEIYELSLRFTTDKDIQELNDRYRQQNLPTDVLAFAALEVDYPKPPDCVTLYLGDILISVETADRQAQAQNHSLLAELAWLATHGFLHLLGWDHPDEASLGNMLEQQQVLLAEIGIKMPIPVLLD